MLLKLVFTAGIPVIVLKTVAVGFCASVEFNRERVRKHRGLIVMVIAVKLKELTTCSLVKRDN